MAESQLLGVVSYCKEFVEKHGNGVEVVYSLSGWLKGNPASYNIRLVSGPKLPEAKQEFDDSYSVQVYSVQACIPKDPAALWNAEFLQAEELFKQPSTIDNCLRDNRFCGILNSFIKRNVDGTSLDVSSLHHRSVVGLGPTTNLAHQSITVPQSLQNKGQQSSSKAALLSPSTEKDVKSESNGSGVHAQASKPPAAKKIPPMPVKEKKVQKDKGSSSIGGSLANLWGRASAKSKPSCPAENSNLIPNPTESSAEAQICAREAVEGVSSDDDVHDINVKRASNGEGTRKRRVVLDFSDDDEYEGAVSLASPDIVEGKSGQKLKESVDTLVPEKSNLNFDEQVEDKPKVKEEMGINKKSNQPLEEDSSVVSKDRIMGPTEKKNNCIPENDINEKDKSTKAAPDSPKRRKVLKTHIDERGREITEVISEGQETAEPKKADSGTMKADNNTVTSAVNRAPAAKKSPAVSNTGQANPTGKAANKKAGNKDPKQGNILSFFKRV
ncbi:hypothetical protein FNV43_RR16296 [Rhamnella rubrinervis]|uniref:DNA polymerase delta subunit 3 n=1 Tax=Rhamnella rubrinervis TaxID=2594499 RepID=A0A8K0GYJ2_9ROSA|nr:hypothetical protein FNV43_RR16296 [Rhamnella rubrinervis]